MQHRARPTSTLLPEICRDAATRSGPHAVCRDLQRCRNKIRPPDRLFGGTCRDAALRPTDTLLLRTCRGAAQRNQLTETPASIVGPPAVAYCTMKMSIYYLDGPALLDLGHMRCAAYGRFALGRLALGGLDVQLWVVLHAHTVPLVGRVLRVGHTCTNSGSA